MKVLKLYVNLHKITIKVSLGSFSEKKYEQKN